VPGFDESIQLGQHRLRRLVGHGSCPYMRINKYILNMLFMFFVYTHQKEENSPRRHRGRREEDSGKRGEEKRRLHGRIIEIDC